MAQGRGGAMVATTVLLCLLLLLRCEIAHAACFKVGGDSGWSFNVSSWPNGKTFKAGDVLVFNYSPQFHNVIVVNKAGYDKCMASQCAPVHKTGNDKINLVKGQNFFICGFPKHCSDFGMKIAINAE